MSQVSQELCKLQSSNMAYIWRMNCCILRYGRRLNSLILPFYIFLFLSLCCMSDLKICVSAFSGNFEARIMKLGAHIRRLVIVMWD